MQIQPCTDEIFRVRYSDENNFTETLMERYDILKTDWEQVKANLKTENSDYILETAGYSLFVDRKTGAFTVKDKNDKIVLTRIGLSGTNTPTGLELGRLLNSYFGKGETGEEIIGGSDYNVKKSKNKRNKNRYKEVGDLTNNSIIEILLKDDERFYGGIL